MSPLFPQHSFISLRTIIWTVALTIVALLLLAYVGYQARFFLVGPQLSLSEAPSTPTQDKVVEIKGTANNIVSISLNGRDIFTDPSGVFSERVVLHKGLNTITIVAHDRFNREAQIHKEYVYLGDDTQEKNSGISSRRHTYTRHQ